MKGIFVNEKNFNYDVGSPYDCGIASDSGL